MSRKNSNFLGKNHSLTSGGGTRNLTAGVDKTSKNAKKVAFSVDNPAKV